MNKFKIGDILEAKKNIQLSSWSKEKCIKGEKMQISKINIQIDHRNNETIKYSLCFPDKAAFIRTEGYEDGIEKLFNNVSEGKIEYCDEWFHPNS